MNRQVLVLLGLALVVAVAMIAIVGGGQPSSGLVDASQFAELQEAGVRIVDVRTAAEFAGGHIPGAENVPLSSFADTSAGWDPSVPVALYCATGNRSAEAAEMLNARGFETVYDLSGGVVAWDGPLDGGAQATPSPAAPPRSGLPVVYEFYTDW